MNRFHLLTAAGAASIGLAACGDYDNDQAYDQQGNAAYGAGESEEKGGTRYATPVGNIVIPEGSRIVIEPGGTRVRIDRDGTRVRIGDGADVRVGDGEIDATVRTGEDSQVSVQTNRR